MSHLNPIQRPYIPQPSPKARFLRNYSRHVAYAIQMRGDNDDIPYIIYLGAPLPLVSDVYESLRTPLANAVHDIRIYHEHQCLYRNGKAYRRISVGFHGLNSECLTLDNILDMAHRKMQTLCWCSVSEIPLKKLINL